MNDSRNSTDDFDFSFADTTWIAISTCLAFIMFPGLGFFYGGIAHRKNLLTILLSTTLGLSVVSIQVNSNFCYFYFF